MKRTELINSILDAKEGSSSYLEIGVRNGKCFFSINSDFRIAVDPNFKIGKRTYLNAYLRRPLQWFRDSFFSLTSDEFFATAKDFLIKRKPDVIFIDGLHTYDQSFRDVMNGLEVLNDRGVIVMHDCNPVSEAEAIPAMSPEEVAAMNLPDWRNIWCGDVWKTITHLRTLPGLEVFVLNSDFGLGIVRKKVGAAPSLSISTETLRKLSYNDLKRDRGNLINLKPVRYGEGFLTSIREHS